MQLARRQHATGQYGSTPSHALGQQMMQLQQHTLGYEDWHGLLSGTLGGNQAAPDNWIALILAPAGSCDSVWVQGGRTAWRG